MPSVFAGRFNGKVAAAATMCLLHVSTVLAIAACIAGSSAQFADSQEQPCSGGFCVPGYLCRNGTIELYGEGIIDKRFADSECADELVCCSEANMGSADETVCQGTCVPFYQCPNGIANAAGKDIINLRLIDSGCPGELVCCPNQDPKETANRVGQVPCKCVAFYQCLDDTTYGKTNGGLDIRLTENKNCPGDEVCCRNVRPSRKDNVIVVESSCKGMCVPFSQCPTGKMNTAVKDSLDLRNYDDCPTDQICCDVPKFEIPEVCDGKCVPFYQCSAGSLNTGGKDLLDLRRHAGICPRDQVCCKDTSVATRIPSNTVQKTNCDGTCVPFYQCSNGNQNTGGQGLINLRGYDDACPGDLVCCKDTKPVSPPITTSPKQSCKGACVPFYQCPMGKLNTGGKDLLNLRSYDDCPNDQVCCEIPTLEVPKVCGGRCVPFYQCPVGSINTGGKDVLDLRAQDGLCPGDQVCCNDAPPAVTTTISTMGQKTNCDGTCVPFYQCPKGNQNTDGEGLLNLRGYDDACPGDLVCCKNTKPVSPPIATSPKQSCKGACVPFYQCPMGKLNTGGKDLLNLRSYDDCPNDQVCCEIPPLELPKVCGGQCVPFYQCPVGSMNTGGKDQLDLRAQDGLCPGDQVCCNVAPPAVMTTVSTMVQKTNCEGTCVPFYQCPKGNQNTGGQGLINLRGYDDACPGDLVCCKDTKPVSPPITTSPKQSCKGACVPFYQCPMGKLNTGGKDLLNLRSYDDCPNDQVCCEIPPLEVPMVCTGRCVPFYQCPAGSINTGGKDLLDLRAQDGLCPGDQVCCNDAPEVLPAVPTTPSTMVQKTNCDGTCVPFYQCPKGNQNTGGEGLLNLRGYDDACPGDLVCCINSKPMLPPSTHLKPVIPSTTIPKTDCDGTCVPFYQCPKGQQNTGGEGLLNLRGYDDACPGDSVCCKDVPPSPPKTSCRGTCVPFNECPLGNRNFAGNNLLDLRTSDDCPNELVCCTPTKTLETVKPALVWMSWITDINNMVDQPQSVHHDKCYLNFDSKSAFARENEIPWLVTVWSKDEYLGASRDEYRCVGSLIRNDVVLVPADCVADAAASKLYVRSGDYNLKSTIGIKEPAVTTLSIHPDYDATNTHANVALLFLTTAKANDHLSTACIPEVNEQLNDCILVGWAHEDLLDNANTMALPRKYRVNLQRSSPCPPGSLCLATRSSPNQNCENLHGSPLVCSADQTGRRWKLAGLVTKSNTRCDGSTVPESLLKVSSLQPWIREQLSPSFVQQQGISEPSRRYLPAV